MTGGTSGRKSRKKTTPGAHIVHVSPTACPVIDDRMWSGEEFIKLFVE